jgi:hypothetical protein
VQGATSFCKIANVAAVDRGHFASAASSNVAPPPRDHADFTAGAAADTVVELFRGIASSSVIKLGAATTGAASTGVNTGGTT